MASSSDLVRRFDDRIVETQSGASDVNDFVYKALYEFDWPGMLQPAPMAVAIFGQLNLVAAATDFKLVSPTGGFKAVKYPDSFRASIVQLTNTGASALNQSYASFDEINKRCASIKPAVNNIVTLLMGDEDNSPEENNAAIQKYLPSQIQQLSSTINICHNKAQEMDDVFHDLLCLTMEIHESCSATQGENEAKIRDAELRKAILDEQEKTANEIKKLSAEDLDRSRSDFAAAREQFNRAADSMPSGWDIAGFQLVDGLTRLVTFPISMFDAFQSSRSNQNQALSNAVGNSNASAGNQPADNSTNVNDPGYKQATIIRQQAMLLQAILTSGPHGGINWNVAALDNDSGCRYIRLSLSLVIEHLEKHSKKRLFSASGRSEATAKVLDLAARGIRLSDDLLNAAPTQRDASVKKLTQDILQWVSDAVSFAADADMKLKTNLINQNAFLSVDENAGTGGGVADMAIKNAQYRLAVAEAQLSASRENQRKSADKMLEVTASLGDILGEIAGLDMQKIEWDKIRQILIRAISFLCQLKGCLDNLVHFFTNVNNLVSVSLQDSATQFIQIIEDATKPGAVVKTVGGVTLDRWARQVIYSQAISAAKVGRLVENVADLYVKMYNGNIHPGVNMLLGMGGLIGSSDQAQIAIAGNEIQMWAKSASANIRQLVNERMREYESDIQDRTAELEVSLGRILPADNEVKKIVDQARENRVIELGKERDAAAGGNPLYKRRMPRNLGV